MLLFSKRSQMTSKCGKDKKKDTHCVLHYRPTATWILFASYDKKAKCC